MSVGATGLTRATPDVEPLTALLDEWKEPGYRVTQIREGLLAHRRPLADLTTLGRNLRERLAGALPETLEAVTEATSADAMTTKYLWRTTTTPVEIETVLMRNPGRATVCVSSQAGCAMACTFCATGQAGLDRHLSAAEIVEQVLRAQHASPERVSNVVYMGMGEPLANYEPVWESIERLHGDLGISARHLTVSTVGVVPGMRRLAREHLPVTLAVSLHAPEDELRARLVPLDRRYPIAEVLDAAAEVAGAHGRRVTFEYAVIDRVNDDLEHGHALGRLLRAWPGVGGSHVNLIPLNPTSGFPGRAPDPRRVRRFAEVLAEYGVGATVRRNRGTDIDAACGQLRERRGRAPVAPPTRMAP